jgi:2-hydroxychromene-2-carboxylate isomerase
MKPPPLQFWFEFASTYSYPAAMRVGPAAAAAGISVDWRPFLLGPIFFAQGWTDSPFNIYPAKGSYMWHDVARTCARHGIPFAKPSVFPRNGLLAARIACLAAGEPWGEKFVCAVYTANFARDEEISDPRVLIDVLDGLGQPGAALVERAHEPDNKSRLRAQTEEATRLGIFGAPTLIASGEMFWGNDRLEEAIECCALGAASATRR